MVCTDRNFCLVCDLICVSHLLHHTNEVNPFRFSDFSDPAFFVKLPFEPWARHYVLSAVPSTRNINSMPIIHLCAFRIAFPHHSKLWVKKYQNSYSNNSNWYMMLGSLSFEPHGPKQRVWKLGIFANTI